MTTSNLAQATGTVSQKPNAFWAFIDRLPGTQFLKNLNIGTKLNIGFGILVFLTLAGAIVSYIGSTQATAQIDTTEAVRVPTALASARAQADLLKMLGDVRGYLALGEGQFQDSYEEARQAFEADLVELEQLSSNLNEENRLRLEDLRLTFTKWSALPDKLFELRDDQLEREPAYALLATEGIRTAGSALIDIQSMIETQAQREPSRQNMEL
jgi:CHASE3 domain sensor protein